MISFSSDNFPDALVGLIAKQNSSRKAHLSLPLSYIVNHLRSDRSSYSFSRSCLLIVVKMLMNGVYSTLIYFVGSLTGNHGVDGPSAHPVLRVDVVLSSSINNIQTASSLDERVVVVSLTAEPQNSDNFVGIHYGAQHRIPFPLNVSLNGLCQFEQSVVVGYAFGQNTVVLLQITGCQCSCSSFEVFLVSFVVLEVLNPYLNQYFLISLISPL